MNCNPVNSDHTPCTRWLTVPDLTRVGAELIRIYIRDWQRRTRTTAEHACHCPAMVDRPPHRYRCSAGHRSMAHPRAESSQSTEATRPARRHPTPAARRCQMGVDRYPHPPLAANGWRHVWGYLREGVCGSVLGCCCLGACGEKYAKTVLKSVFSNRAKEKL